MATAFLDFPREILNIVCSHLRKPELAAVRLTCRCLTLLPEPYLFEVIHVNLHADPLYRLEALSLHPRLGGYVRDLLVSTTFYPVYSRSEWEQSIDSELSETDQLNAHEPPNGDLVNLGAQLSTQQMDEWFQRYEEAIKKQTRFLARPVPEIYYRVSASLGRFCLDYCSLRSLTRYKYITPPPYPSQLRKFSFQDVERTLDKDMSESITAVLLAVLNNACRSNNLVLQPSVFAPLLYLDELWLPPLDTAMPEVEELFLTLEAPSDPGEHNMMLEMNYRQALLAFECLLFRYPNLNEIHYNPWRQRKPFIFYNVEPMSNICRSKLNYLSLSSNSFRVEDLLSILKTSAKTLYVVYFNMLRLVGGSWVDLFTQMRNILDLERFRISEWLSEENGVWDIRGKGNTIGDGKSIPVRKQVVRYVLRKAGKMPLLLSDNPDAEEQWKEASDASMIWRTHAEMAQQSTAQDSDSDIDSDA